MNTLSGFCNIIQWFLLLSPRVVLILSSEEEFKRRYGGNEKLSKITAEKRTSIPMEY